MMMVMKRKEVLIGALILLIGVAAFINFNYTQADEDAALKQASSTEVAEDVPETAEEAVPAEKMGEAQLVSAGMDSYFSQARVSRESARSTTISRLNELVENPNIDLETKQQAQNELLEIAGVADRETAAENMIRAKGFEDAVVYISGEAASVTVKAETLSEVEVAKIQDIVASQAQVEIKNIKIVEVE